MLREPTSNFEQATEVSFHDSYTLAVAEYVAQIFDNRTKYVEMPNQTNPGEIETTNISRIHEPSTLQTSGTCSHPDACCEPSSVCLSCVEGGPAARADIAGAELCCSAGTSTWPGLTVPSSCIHVGNLTTKGWMAPRSSKARQASWTRAHSASVFGRVLQERSGSNVPPPLAPHGGRSGPAQRLRSLPAGQWRCPRGSQGLEGWTGVSQE